MLHAWGRKVGGDSFEGRFCIVQRVSQAWRGWNSICSALLNELGHFQWFTKFWLSKKYSYYAFKILSCTARLPSWFFLCHPWGLHLWKRVRCSLQPRRCIKCHIQHLAFWKKDVSLLMNKHPCVRAILGRNLFPEELVSNVGKSWPSKMGLFFSVLMEVSVHSGDWSLAAAKNSKYLDHLFAVLFLVVVRTATRAVERHGKIMSLGAKKNLLKGGKRDEETELHSSWIFNISWEAFQSN